MSLSIPLSRQGHNTTLPLSPHTHRHHTQCVGRQYNILLREPSSMHHPTGPDPAIKRGWQEWGGGGGGDSFLDSYISIAGARSTTYPLEQVLALSCLSTWHAHIHISLPASPGARVFSLSFAITRAGAIPPTAKQCNHVETREKTEAVMGNTNTHAHTVPLNKGQSLCNKV